MSARFASLMIPSYLPRQISLSTYGMLVVGNTLFHLKGMKKLSTLSVSPTIRNSLPRLQVMVPSGCGIWVTGNASRSSKIITKVFSAVAFFHNSDLLASSSEDCMIKIWNAHNGRCLRSLEGHICIKFVQSPYLMILRFSRHLHTTTRSKSGKWRMESVFRPLIMNY